MFAIDGSGGPTYSKLPTSLVSAVVLFILTFVFLPFRLGLPFMRHVDDLLSPCIIDGCDDVI